MSKLKYTYNTCIHIPLEHKLWETLQTHAYTTQHVIINIAKKKCS